jgi:hypothetical protein
MYSTLRNIHLVLGLVIAAFMLAYAASAFRMGHYFLFRWSSPSVETSKVVVQDAPRDPRMLVKKIRDEGDMRGDLFDVATSSTGIAFMVRRPGTQHDVVYDIRTNTAAVTTKSGGFWEMIDKMHHTGGVWHDDPVLSAWGMFVGFSSVCLAIVALTGVFLWFQRNRERRLGGIFLIGSMVVSLALLIIVRVG